MTTRVSIAYAYNMGIEGLSIYRLCVDLFDRSTFRIPRRLLREVIIAKNEVLITVLVLLVREESQVFQVH